MFVLVRFFTGTESTGSMIIKRGFIRLVYKTRSRIVHNGCLQAKELEEREATQSKRQKPRTRRINSATLVWDQGFWKLPGESLAETNLEEWRSKNLISSDDQNSNKKPIQEEPRLHLICFLVLPAFIPSYWAGLREGLTSVPIPHANHS